MRSAHRAALGADLGPGGGGGLLPHLLLPGGVQ